MPVLPRCDGTQFLPTDEVPWIDEDMQTLFYILKKVTLADLRDELWDRAKAFKGEKGATVFNELANHPDGPDGPFMHLLHSMPKDLIEAIILGTVGYQGHEDKGAPIPEKPLSFYNSSGPSAYSVSIHLEGHQGFMTKAELGDVVRAMNRYIKAKDDIDFTEERGIRRNPGQQVEVDFAKGVDIKCRKELKGEDNDEGQDDESQDDESQDDQDENEEEEEHEEYFFLNTPDHQLYANKLLLQLKPRVRAHPIIRTWATDYTARLMFHDPALSHPHLDGLLNMSVVVRLMSFLAQLQEHTQG